MTASHQAVYDRVVDIQSLLSPLSVDARVRLLESIGFTLNATTQPLEARISQLTEEGRALEESLHQSEGQAKKMREHGVALHAEVANFATETAADALCITRESTRVSFALSHLKGQAEDWAYSIRLTNPTSFATFDELVAAMKLRFLPQHSDFQYHSKFLACKQGKLSLQDYIHDLRFLAANVNDDSTLPNELRVNVFMAGLNHDPARTQIFRVYPASSDEAFRIALAEPYASALAHNRADPTDMDISALSHTNDGKCSNCGRKGHFWRECRAPRRTPTPSTQYARSDPTDRRPSNRTSS
ncbi:hypothetical protein DYB32_002236 [Aphanomyces invadans]|uniref:CCHC-type domain-containing protein n=1 Tax=Aphanomyces invadans TaxID=157072 RepID=A0A3R7D4D9_9STRA|nr:hypothetical protein DYB32_002236 [Aphanomyces invadans]